MLLPAVFNKILDEMHLRSQRPVTSASRFAAVGLLRLALALPRVPVPQVAPAVLALDGYKVKEKNLNGLFRNKKKRRRQVRVGEYSTSFRFFLNLFPLYFIFRGYLTTR